MLEETYYYITVIYLVNKTGSPWSNAVPSAKSRSWLRTSSGNSKRHWDNLCPQDPPCAGVRACGSRPVRKRSNCIAHLRLFAHRQPHRCRAGGAALLASGRPARSPILNHAARATVWRACARLRISAISDELGPDGRLSQARTPAHGGSTQIIHGECRFEFPLEVRSQLIDLAEGTALPHSEPVLLTK